MMKKYSYLFLLYLAMFSGCESDYVEELSSGVRALDLKGFITVINWHGDSLYYTALPQSAYMDQKYQITGDTVLKNFIPTTYRGAIFIQANNDGSKILLVRTQYEDVSAGALQEYTTATGELREILDSTYNVSSAVFADQQTAIVYMHGNTEVTPGYYRINLTSGGARACFTVCL